jgi:hypothetical protein
MAKDSFHVISRSDGAWSVRKTGEGRAARVFDIRSDAVAFARSIAKKKKGEIVIHGCDGRIRERDSYGKDPCPPRDKRK